MTSSHSRRRAALVTGGGGFIGAHLANRLAADGYFVVGTVRPASPWPIILDPRVDVRPCDVSVREDVARLVQDVRPDMVFHLAAQSSPSVSWRDPARTFAVNATGTMNVLDAVRTVRPDAVVVSVGSSSIYGRCSPEDVPIQETQAFRPSNPYGVSKAAQDMLAYLYAGALGLSVRIARPFGVIGPGKVGDAASDFARAIVQVECGRKREVPVGNLEAVRDFLDVADAVAALVVIAERGASGEAYNICSGTGRRVQEVLDGLIGHARCPVAVEPDPARMRPADDLLLIGDNGKLRALGWEATVPFEESLKSILAYWRERDGTNG